MNNLEEIKYVKLLSGGDERALKVLFDAYYPRLTVFAAGLLKSDVMAKDIAQDVFVKLWNRRECLADIDSFSSYIFHMTKNDAINLVRRRVALDKYVQKYKEVLDPTQDDEYSAEQTAFMIKLIVENMPEQRRRIFEMSRYGNKSNDEIAQSLGIAKKTVENHINLALHEIKEGLTLSLLICSMSLW